LHDRGIDASQFVAALRYADSDADLAAKAWANDAEAGEEDKKKKQSQPTTTQPPASTQQPSMSGKPSQTGQPGGSSSITKPDASQAGGDKYTGLPSGYQPDNPQHPSAPSGGNGKPLSAETNDPSIGGFAGIPSGSGSGGGNGKPLSQQTFSGGQGGGGAANNIIPSLISAIPEIAGGIGALGSGIGSGISSVTNALSGLGGLLHRANIITSGGGNLPIPNQESFQGSGPDPKYWMGTSKDYVDEYERPDFVDVTNLAGDTTNYGKKPQQGPKKASRRPFVGSENANPEGSTETSGFGQNETTAMPFDQVYKSGAYDPTHPWAGSRIQDFRRYVRQQGGQNPNHQMLTEYLKRPHRNLNKGGEQHLQEYTSYAEQHEASRRYAEEEMSNLASADVPGMSPQLPPTPETHGILASFEDDGSDIVAQFHRMGGIEAINNSGSGGGGGNYSDNAIAEQARGFLRTAGRHFSLSEQRELEEESHPEGARNLRDLDLRGTHYEDAL